jgi:hypothetical protein
MKRTSARLLLLLVCGSLCHSQNPLHGILNKDNLSKAKILGVTCSPGGNPDTVVLRFPASDTPVGLILPLPAVAADWTKYGSLVFTFESNSTLPWKLQVRNRKGRLSETRVYPLAGVGAKVPIALRFFTRDYLGEPQLKGCWIFNYEEHIDMTQVESLGIMMTPNREVTLKLGPIALVQGEVEDDLYVDKPVVDAFGQWIPLEWPGKVHSLEELRRAWEQEDRDLAKPEDFGVCPLGGWRSRTERATGFFHTAQVDGRWWLVDPEGHLFFSIGSNGLGSSGRGGRYKGREQLFASVPPGSGERVDFYRANLALRYGDTDALAKMLSKTLDRMRAWGFNTINGRGLEASKEKNPLPFVAFARLGGAVKNWQGFPDVYSDQFTRSAGEDAVTQCSPLRENRYLIGYFMGNEPHWITRSLLDRILQDPESSATQSFVRQFLKERGDTPASRETLLEMISRHYFQTIKDAMRKADPNHLLLGTRYDNSILGEVDPAVVARDHLWMGIAGARMEPIIRASDVFDVFSINIYAYQPPRQRILEIANIVKRPIMFTEGSVSTEARGYSPGVIEVKDQTERGVGYQYYVEQAASLPAVVGTHYYTWTSTAVTDGWGMLGFVDIVDLPYREQVSFAKAAHKRVYQVHSGQIQPSTRAPRFR